MICRETPAAVNSSLNIAPHHDKYAHKKRRHAFGGSLEAFRAFGEALKGWLLTELEAEIAVLGRHQ